MYSITYRGFLQTVHREFNTYEEATQWLRQIGRPELICDIVKRRFLVYWE